MTFKIIAILSSLAFLTVPTLVLAAKLLTYPKDLVLSFDCWKKGRVEGFSSLVRCTSFAICYLSTGSFTGLILIYFGDSFSVLIIYNYSCYD